MSTTRWRTRTRSALITRISATNTTSSRTDSWSSPSPASPSTTRSSASTSQPGIPSSTTANTTMSDGQSSQSSFSVIDFRFCRFYRITTELKKSSGKLLPPPGSEPRHLWLSCPACYCLSSLLAMIALLAVQSFARTLIHNAILSINTSTMLGTSQGIG